VALSVDEWNVWHQTENTGYARTEGPFEHAPAITEDEHTVADALVVGCLLITLMRHADRVRMACLAQLVNVLPPIRTLDGGPAWRQTTYFPFRHAARLARGIVLRVEPDAPVYEVPDEGAVSVLEATAVLDDDTLSVFAVNRGPEPLALEAPLRDASFVAAEHTVLTGDDLTLSNTAQAPDRVKPRSVAGARVEGGALRAELPARSWNVLRLSR
jgi:alpha-N-arabinofuranosidase